LSSNQCDLMPFHWMNPRRLVDAYLRSGDHPAKQRLVRRWGSRLMPGRGIVTELRGGMRLHLHPRDWIEYLLLTGEEYEPLTLRFLETNLRKGDLGVFAGVNFGLHLAVGAKAVGPTGRVVGFEPQPSSLQRAMENVALNGLTAQVDIVPAALGAETGRLVPMSWASPENTGLASLGFEAARGLHVPVFRFQDALRALGANRPRLLVLDVEGYEGEVLNGIEPACAPEIIVVEVTGHTLARVGWTPERVLLRLRELGYECLTIDGQTVGPGTFCPENNVIATLPGTRVDRD